MPGIDGYETCRRLRANPVTRDIPVLFMTARTGLNDKLQAFALGAVDYVTKPFDAPELVAEQGDRVRAGGRDFDRDHLSVTDLREAQGGRHRGNDPDRAPVRSGVNPRSG